LFRLVSTARFIWKIKPGGCLVVGRPKSRGADFVPSVGNPRPPFEPGNRAALKHGAWSGRLVDPRAAEMVQALLELANTAESPVAYLGDVSYGSAVRAWARCEARLTLLDEYIATHGDLDDEGNPRPASSLMNALEARAEALRSRLGLDPLSRARLGRDIAAGQVDVARLLAALDDEDEEAPDERTATSQA
jgi:hypothetical protein